MALFSQEEVRSTVPLHVLELLLPIVSGRYSMLSASISPVLEPWINVVRFRGMFLGL